MLSDKDFGEVALPHLPTSPPDWCDNFPDRADVEFETPEGVPHSVINAIYEEAQARVAVEQARRRSTPAPHFTIRYETQKGYKPWQFIYVEVRDGPKSKTFSEVYAWDVEDRHILHSTDDGYKVIGEAGSLEEAALMITAMEIHRAKPEK